MTTGHRHRTIRLRRGILLRALRFHLVETTDEARVENSRLVWGVAPEMRLIEGRWHTVYALTPLGVMHTLLGLTVEVYDAR